MLSKISSLLTTLVAITFLSGCTDNKNVIKVATSPFNAPIVYKKNGVLAGTDYALFNAFCEKINCKPEIKEYDFPVMLQAISSGDADIAFSAISITQTRQKTMSFSQPYFQNTLHLVSITPQAEKIVELSELKKYRIGYPNGFVYDEFIRRDLEPSGYYSMSEVTFYLDYAEVLKDMQVGNINLTLMDALTLQRWQSQQGSAVTSVYQFSQKDPWGFAFPLNSSLRNEFDAFLKELGPKGIQDITQRAVNN